MTPTNRRVAPTAPASATPRTAMRIGSALSTVLGVVLVAGGSLGAAWLARRYVTRSERFAVASIEVTGTERRTAEAVIADSGIAMGVNLFSVDLDAAHASISADPWIADAVLSRRLPGTIVIHVRERRAAALVALGDLLLATDDGEPFKKLEPGDPVDLPLITGLSPERVADDREDARRTIRRAIDLAAEYGQGALAKRASLQEVHVDEGGSLSLLVGHSAMQLVLGGPPFRRKLDEATRVVGELEKRHAQASTIMLDNEVRPERVVARLR